VGVHGDERFGVAVVKALIPALRIRSGTVVILPGNPRAIRKNVRYTETNLNRLFKANVPTHQKRSYEWRRAQILKKYLDSADVLLDIHGSFTPRSLPFLICEQSGFNLAGQLPFPMVVSGFDDNQPGGTDCYMNRIGKIGICAECGYLGDPEAKNIAKKTILAFLSARGHIRARKTSRRKQQRKQIEYMYLTKTSRFKLAKAFKDFEPIKKAQLIGKDGDEEIRSKKAGFVLFARDGLPANDEAYLFGV
jgi:succinylglutamate desuccinylase